MSTKDEDQRRVEWRRNRILAVGSLVDLDTGKTIARWFERDPSTFVAQTFSPLDESMQGTSDAAERWCMERVRPDPCLHEKVGINNVCEGCGVESPECPCCLGGGGAGS